MADDYATLRTSSNLAFTTGCDDDSVVFISAAMFLADGGMWVNGEKSGKSPTC